MEKRELTKNGLSTRLMEMYSSAFTLSDMEVFVFPDLLYALVLANIMSPVIWEWRKDPWFRNILKKSYVQRINRVKQYIMDHYVFNLDLETWGLTTKETELMRFNDFLDEETVAKSNALFGYEGDKYYFNIDIRKHFGLDKYTSNIIPYWKTETVEAMEAFRHKDEYSTGAGECVSLSTLYAAALFIVARIPLEKIFLMATPLHSQNFIDMGDGVLTNNRRIVTKNMWFNGTSISSKARRALENEEVTIVSHITGQVHTVYKEATIDARSYRSFQDSLSRYLKADFKPEIISNFLRRENRFQCCFQYQYEMHGRTMFIEVEKIYKYEHSSPNSFSTDSRTALLKEIDFEEFSFTPIGNRLILNYLEDFIKNHPDSTIDDLDGLGERELFIEKCPETEEMFKSLKDFLVVRPRLPGGHKEMKAQKSLSIPVDFSREDVVRYTHQKSESIEMARLALYAYRDMGKINWEPFLKAALERNPVSLEGLKGKSLDDILNLLSSLENQSIYSDQRLALPDEVWNFHRGDGIEKAILFMNVLRARNPQTPIELSVQYEKVTLTADGESYTFRSNKGLNKQLTI